MAGLERVIVHWTGGAGRASETDLKHYHLLVERDGSIRSGKESPEDNIVVSDGDYAAHTLRLNTGSIGVAMCGMRDAIEQPFSPGPEPLTEEQFEECCIVVAMLCDRYGIPVSPRTVLTHAEVEANLGVAQRGKWDISRLVFKPELVGAAAVGAYLRDRVRAYRVVHEDDFDLVDPEWETERQKDMAARPVLRFGARGVAVAELQTDLAGLGYFSGRIDGIFGPLTRASVLAFQADNGLATDGIVGRNTWLELEIALPRPEREVSMSDLEEESGTVQDAMMAARAGDVVGLGGVAAVIATATEAVGAAEEVSGAIGGLVATVAADWQLAALAGLCLVAWVAIRAIAHRTKQRRLRDARELRSLSR